MTWFLTSRANLQHLPGLSHLASESRSVETKSQMAVSLTSAGINVLLLTPFENHSFVAAKIMSMRSSIVEWLCTGCHANKLVGMNSNIILLGDTNLDTRLRFEISLVENKPS